MPLKVDGGASANDFLMQFQADILNSQVVRPSCIETTALGAAYLAGLATGFWPDAVQVEKNWSQEKCFLPSMEEAKESEIAQKMGQGSCLCPGMGRRIENRWSWK